MNRRIEWRTSTFSVANNDCVQLAVDRALTRVRDSKTPDAGTLVFDRECFATFLAVLKS
ncbi:hypothetical protein ALI144C_48750 [Actinosynnema sp. ALI-1.44]|uniref:DUF397 domain-containing protein n=1 Tax=Actinosynnema sp. ALI-1.44 TaxID=1933779 RepID=UPI00097BBE8E|nr:DUF397 domain-containing protein [Actinosynnema sp. ALI-1.44]ONI70534.1 hypothetical protein ALI144C_48750 [Actinosynnema sp. ALI-1.44]